MATHSSILALRIPWTEEPSGLQSIGCKEWARLRNLHSTRPLLELLCSLSGQIGMNYYVTSIVLGPGNTVVDK